MGINDDMEYNNYNRGNNNSYIFKIVGVSVAVLLILLIVIASNRGDKRNINRSDYSDLSSVSSDVVDKETSIGSTIDSNDNDGRQGLTADKLDFWNLYPKEDTENPKSTTEATIPSSKPPVKDVEKEEDEEEVDPSQGGRYVHVKRHDGVEEWVLINPNIKKNTYDYANISLKGSSMSYLVDGKVISVLGVDISKDNGVIDFNRLKQEQVSYVMIKLGSRGYRSGILSIDDNYEKNYQDAIKAGLDVGVYFYSQATTAEEALEEAKLVTEKLANKTIRYPVGYVMEYIPNDTARMEGLSRDQKTHVANVFLTYIKDSGYTPILYGDKEWLMERIDITKLGETDVWLRQEDDIPDYPYRYTMWQYNRAGNIGGIQGNASMNICMINYNAR